MAALITREMAALREAGDQAARQGEESLPGRRPSRPETRR